MAQDISATLLRSFREKSNFDKNERLYYDYGAFDFVKNDGNTMGGIVTPSLRARARDSYGKTLTTIVQPRQSPNFVTARTLTFTPNAGSTAIVTLTFVTKGFQIVMPDDIFKNNDVTAQEYYNKEMKTNLIGMMDWFDAQSLTAIANKVTQVYNDSLGYTVTGNTIICPYTSRDSIIGDARAMMSANGFKDTAHMIGDYRAESLVRYLQKFGANNSVDQTKEYQGVPAHYTKNITRGTGIHSSFYMVNAGNFGILDRAEYASDEGRQVSDFTWGTEVLPGIGIRVGTLKKVEVKDFSTFNGGTYSHLTRSSGISMEYIADFCFVSAYNSDATTIPNPVIKVDIQKAI